MMADLGIAEIRAEGRRLWADYSESDETGVTRDEWERWWYFHADVLLADPSPKCRRIGGPVTLAQSLHMVQPGQEIPKLVFDVCEQVLERFTVCVPAPAPADVLLADPAPVGLTERSPEELDALGLCPFCEQVHDPSEAHRRRPAAPVGLTEKELRLVSDARELAPPNPDYPIPWDRYLLARLVVIIDRLSAAPVDDRERVDKWRTVPDGWEVRFDHDCEGTCWEDVPASACPDRKPFLVPVSPSVDPEEGR